MSALTYKILHIFAILLTFTALGAAISQALAGSGKGSPGHKMAGVTHGIALALILISGFGLLAKLGLGFPLWVWVKIVIWLLIGGALALVRRMPQHATVFWLAIPLLGGFAAYLALYKPF